MPPSKKEKVPSIHQNMKIPKWMFDSELDPKVLKLLRILYRKYAAKSDFISNGRNRVTFGLGTIVVKIPRNVDGINDNDWEEVSPTAKMTLCMPEPV